MEQSGRLLSDGTRARKKTGNAWYEIQDTCAYHEDFAKDKLVWIELVERGRFAYDNSAIFAEATAFIMTGESLKYLLGFLNSALARWYLSHAAPTSGMGTLRWKKVYVEAVPIPRVAEEKQQSVVQHVDRILLAKSADSDADVSDLESKIDELIFDLYGFTDEEIETMRSSV